MANIHTHIHTRTQSRLGDQSTCDYSKANQRIWEGGGGVYGRLTWWICWKKWGGGVFINVLNRYLIVFFLGLKKGYSVTGCAIHRHPPPHDQPLRVTITFS